MKILGQQNFLTIFQQPPPCYDTTAAAGVKRSDVSLGIVIQVEHYWLFVRLGLLILHLND